MLLISTYVFRDILNMGNNNKSSSLENVTEILNKLHVLPDVDQKHSTYIDDIKWDKALAFGKKALKDKDYIENHMKPLEYDHPSYKHQKLLATSTKIRNISRIGFSEQQASKYLKWY